MTSETTGCSILLQSMEFCARKLHELDREADRVRKEARYFDAAGTGAEFLLEYGRASLDAGSQLARTASAELEYQQLEKFERLQLQVQFAELIYALNRTRHWMEKLGYKA